MGSFDYTCAISGLPVGSGSGNVRYMLVTENDPACGEEGLYAQSWWSPRTFPLTATYSDCGMVDSIQEGVQRDLWVKLLSTDIIEHGTGDNQCHDIASYMDDIVADFNQILEQCREHMLIVQPNRWRERRGRPDTGVGTFAMEAEKRLEPDDGIPRLARLRHELMEAGHTIYGADGGPDGYYINEIMPGEVTIRQAGYGREGTEALEKLLPLLSAKYNPVLLPAGKGMAPATIRVFPKMGVSSEEFWGFDEREGKHMKGRADRERPRRVATCYIREDVWNALCSITLPPTWWHKDELTIESFVRDARELYDTFIARECTAVEDEDAHEKRTEALLADPNISEDLKAAIDLTRMRSFKRYLFNFWSSGQIHIENSTQPGRYNKARCLQDNLIYGEMHRSGEGHPGTVGWSDHFEAFARAHASHSEQEVTDFLRVVAESCMVGFILGMLWRKWVPSCYAGQDSHAETQVAFASALAKVAKDWKREQDEEYAAFEAEDVELGEDEALPPEPASCIGITSGVDDGTVAGLYVMSCGEECPDIPDVFNLTRAKGGLLPNPASDTGTAAVAAA